MKKAAGFTLIELVIVIVILGILGAVAAPRFINLQGDAYEANVNALRGSIQSAMTLGNTKAILAGQDVNTTDEDDEPVAQVVAIDGTNGVNFLFGYPAATTGGILEMLQDVDVPEDDQDTSSSYILNTETANTLRIAPRARGFGDNEAEQCEVIYVQATGVNNPASVTAVTNGC
ncbi:MSHA biogenesis protein MshA [Zobellella endophytica]|uniref:MSHA biogenesis protein MshA n=2 Tax=Zobellella endophytica TaxID=2116700 RepID=A0A2P7RBZ9_9GAMM|nr:MSHA biogenesis protein MshA [Zobellella endophytica]